MGRSKVAFTLTVNDDDITWWQKFLFAASGIMGIAVIIGVFFIVKSKRRNDSTRWHWIAVVVSVVTGSAVTVAAIFIIRAMRRNNILSKVKRIESSSLSAQVPTESEGHMASSVTRGDDAGNIPQTTPAGADKLCNVQQQLGQHAPREESGIRFMCQGGDIVQVLLESEQPNNPETNSLLDPSVSADRQETLVMVTNRQHEDYLTPCMHSYRTLPPLRGGNQNITALTVYEAGKEVAPVLPQASSQQSDSVATPDIKVHYCEESQYVTIE